MLHRMRYLKQITVWLFQVLLAVVMIGPGLQKFTSPAWEHMFRRWGYPDHFYLVIGAVEVVGGLALLVPRTASAGALVLVPVMIAAAITQITRGGRNGVGELVFAALLTAIAWARWPGVLAGLLARPRVGGVRRSV
jgi:putative oxidoreductase